MKLDPKLYICFIYSAFTSVSVIPHPIKSTESQLYFKPHLRSASAHKSVNFLGRKQMLFILQSCTFTCNWIVETTGLKEEFQPVLAGVLPFKVNIVARKDILNHNYSFCIYLWTNHLWEVQFGTKKISNWPQPFLSKEWRERWLLHLSLWKGDSTSSRTEETCSYRSLVIIKTSGYIIVVIVKSIIIYSTVNHITARKKKEIMQTKSSQKTMHKNGKQKWTKHWSLHLHLTMVKQGRPPPGFVFYVTMEFQIWFKLVN